MAHIILSTIREEERHRVVGLLEAARECASMPLHTRAKVASLLLMHPHEIRQEVREALDAEGCEEVRR